MALPGVNSSLKRLRSRYKLIILNEDTYDEVINFKLTRWGIYTTLSILFVLLVGITVALIMFTPLKLYVPGYKDSRNVKQFELLKIRVDSLEQNLIQKQQYIDDIEKILKGNIVPRDTTILHLKNPGTSPD